MNTIQLIFLLVFIPFSLKSQDIKSLIYVTRQADEPPLREGQPTYKIIFRPDEKGNFMANKFKKNGKNYRFHKISIPSSKIQFAINQNIKNDSVFPIVDFNVDINEINKSIENYDFVLIKNIREDLEIKLDSFNYCNQLITTTNFLIGGYSNYVYVTFSSGDTLTLLDFHSGDLGLRKFPLKDYLITYQLIGDLIPFEFPFSEYFRNEKFREVVLYYLQTIECEDYWYQEFIKENPNRTARENRMKVDWDFREYMNRRKKLPPTSR